jgi:probable phosphoglycerate mutase
MEGYNGEGFLADAKAHSDYDPKSVMVAMRGQERAGILQLDLLRDADGKVGAIPFFYLTPETRTQGLGVQLLGQAVSTYRPLGREFLRLRCAPENIRARRFYERYGFQKIGQEPGGIGTLDVLEKFIGYGLN